MVATDTPRIYVACLASYNAGVLYGEWLDFTSLDEVRDAIAAMLRGSPHPNVQVTCPKCEGENDGAGCTNCAGGKVPSAEEWAVHDHEGWEGLCDSEYPDLEKLAEQAEALEEHGPAYGAYASNVGTDYATPDGFEEAYMGRWDSERAYAENFAEEVGAIADDHPMACYIDWDHYAHSLFQGDYYSVDAGPGVYVFMSC